MLHLRGGAICQAPTTVTDVVGLKCHPCSRSVPRNESKEASSKTVPKPAPSVRDVSEHKCQGCSCTHISLGCHCTHSRNQTRVRRSRIGANSLGPVRARHRAAMPTVPAIVIPSIDVVAASIGAIAGRRRVATSELWAALPVAPRAPDQARLARAYASIRRRVRHTGAIATTDLATFIPILPTSPFRRFRIERSATPRCVPVMAYDRVVVVPARDDALLPLRP